MKVLKILLYIVLGFVGLFFLVSLFMPSSIEFERSIEIEAPVENVFVQTNVMKNWEKWNPWFEIDPDMEVTYEGAEAGVGASYSWSSDNSKVGSGKQTIIESEPNQHIKTELYFQGEKGGTGYWNYDEVDGKTNVTWGMNGELGFFMRIMGVFMRGMMEDMFDDGLAKIKEIAEAMPTIDISVVEVQSQKVLFVRDSAKISDNNISELYGKGYGEMGQFVGENNIQMTGMPMSKAVVWEPDNDRFVFDLMFPIAETKAKPTGRMGYANTYAGKTAKAIKFGPYEGVAAAYEALEKYINENGFEIIGSPWEIYVNDPTTVKPEEIETHIFFPIK